MRKVSGGVEIEETHLVVMKMCQGDEAYDSYLTGRDWDCLILNRNSGRWVGKVVDVKPKRERQKKKRRKRKRRR